MDQWERGLSISFLGVCLLLIFNITWRTGFRGQAFAAVKTEAPCPRQIDTTAGVQVKKDRIELCFTMIPRDEPVPGFACSPEAYVKYEIMRVPEDVEPKFVFVGACTTPR